ncbi:MAG TPA: hypothetical protein VMW38_21495 [Terriglobia bacterium]|nr:hypothetical protein [Terriglobia bacterium]
MGGFHKGYLLKSAPLRLTLGIVSAVLGLYAMWFSWISVYLGGEIVWMNMMALGIIMVILGVRLIVLGGKG